jgi:hypothetical protein
VRAVWKPGIVGVLVAVAGRWAYRRLVAGDLAMDLSIRRTIRPLGPQDERIAAPRHLVFEVIAAPYLASPPSSVAEKIQVLARSEDMVLAAHRTALGRGMVATTVETVRFERPVADHFRLVRGPVPHVVERFELTEDGTARSSTTRASSEPTSGSWAGGGETAGGEPGGRRARPQSERGEIPCR